MEHLKSMLLTASLLANAAAIAFVVVLTQTAYFDVPLAAYSHQKNCVSDFDSVLKQADALPAANRDQAKQLYASVICQKDFQTGQPLANQDFTKALQLLQNQVPSQGGQP